MGREREVKREGGREGVDRESALFISSLYFCFLFFFFAHNNTMAMRRERENQSP
jgi:hypothetical protein